MKSLTDSALDALRAYIDRVHRGNIAAASRDLQVNTTTLHSWLKGERLPSFSRMAPALDRIGAHIVAPPEEETRPVCFVNAKIVPAGDDLQPPIQEDYLAVPLVEEAGAGPGILPQGRLLSWFLVWKHQISIQHRSDLIAVRIGRNSTSMVPTLRPQDIVLVDRQDKDVDAHKGRIMLVMDPLDGSGKIKRVSVEDLPQQRDYRVVFYSDNSVEYPPEVYSLAQDFDGDWTRAIVGKVVWAWTDVSKK